MLLDIGHPSTLVIPLTTNLVEDAAPPRIRIQAQGHLAKDSDLLIDQLRAIDNARLPSGPLAVAETLEQVLFGEVYESSHNKDS